MRVDEAAEAGRLVEALENADGQLTWLDKVDAGEDDDDISVRLGNEHSDAGSSGPGYDAIVGPAMAREVVGFLRGRILARLAELGVEA
jgi:hypothetical protein